MHCYLFYIELPGKYHCKFHKSTEAYLRYLLGMDYVE